MSKKKGTMRDSCGDNYSVKSINFNILVVDIVLQLFKMLQKMGKWYARPHCIISYLHMTPHLTTSVIKKINEPEKETD